VNKKPNSICRGDIYGARNKEPELSVDIAGIKMKNPVMTASGTFGYGEEYADLIDLNKLGAIVVKGITLKPREGNPPPRIVETPSGMLNAIGLENPGVEAFVKEKLPFLGKFNTPLIVNIAGEKIEEYEELAKRLDDEEGIAGLELNISCPNIKLQASNFNLQTFAQDPKMTYEVVSKTRKATKLPLITKLSPEVRDITEIAKAAEEGGTDALSLINTLRGMAIDIETKKSRLASITGGLSGPALKPVALAMVWEVYKTVSLPIIGMGGIMEASEALEFFIAGASAVALGTANFVNPKASLEVIEGIRDYLIKHDIKNIKELTGTLSA
jgi:dihydroorotate dehydrogenase (NAD+) catalytic subunit